MSNFGTSFSLHRCSELGLDKKAVLLASIKELGFKRFRLMSYWNIHESQPGKYDFSELDWQMDMIAEHGGTVSLCLGKRQPRWPECHMPKWAADLPQAQWYESLYDYIREVVKRYKDHPALESWQLENEALLREFGYCPDGDYNRKRLITELEIVKSADPHHPIIMTLSDSWGIPWLGPKPDKYAMSLYRITVNKHGNYAYSKRPAWFYRLRAFGIRILQNRRVFIHELQAEPWLAKGITKTATREQLEQMSPEMLTNIINYAKRTGLEPIDLWGLEWWYWLNQNGHFEVWQYIKSLQKH